MCRTKKSLYLTSLFVWGAWSLLFAAVVIDKPVGIHTIFTLPLHGPIDPRCGPEYPMNNDNKDEDGHDLDLGSLVERRGQLETTLDALILPAMIHMQRELVLLQRGFVDETRARRFAQQQQALLQRSDAQ